jgi:hypothetical protein
MPVQANDFFATAPGRTPCSLAVHSFEAFQDYLRALPIFNLPASGL